MIIQFPQHFQTKIETPPSLTPSSLPQYPTFALVGNPNAGKSTIFNQLTGLHQKVANYPGVTVEKKIGTCFSQHGQKLLVIDLPGAHSLSPTSPDEAILQKVLMGKMPGTPLPNVIICVLDASNLKRHLPLALQVLELGTPVIIALNMIDVAKKNNLSIDIPKLEHTLGVPIIPLQATKKDSIIPLKLAMSRKSIPVPKKILSLPKPLSDAVLSLQSLLLPKCDQNLFQARAQALYLLIEGTDPLSDSHEVSTRVSTLQSELNTILPNWRSSLIQERNQLIDTLCKDVLSQKTPPPSPSLTDRLDRFFLHPLFGSLSLLCVMGFLLWTLFSFAQYPMNAIEFLFAKITFGLDALLPAGPLKNLLIDGVLSGIGSTLVFLPQIFFLFFFIGLLESSGYLPRAALLLDKIFSRVGLQGKSFIPLLSSYACAIPGIMATRTIGNPKERLTTILIAPWMSCSARLPIFLLMITTLLPNHHSPLIKSLILLSIYLIGTTTAFLFAFIFRKTLLKGKSTPSPMELPTYHAPHLKSIAIDSLEQCILFIKKAGTLIFAFSVLLWFLRSYPEPLPNSYLGVFGKWIQPVLEPLGYDWKIAIALLASFAARELFVSTLAILYTVQSPFLTNASLSSILSTQVSPSGTPIFSSLTCISLIVFFIFAMQCTSTLAIVKRETNSYRWPLFQLIFMTSFAYLATLITYQLGKFFFY